MKGFNVSEWAVKHPSFVLFLIVACAAAGLSAYVGMGRAEDPAFTIKVMVVSAQWPGATADEMQRQVADKIEEKLQETPHLDYIKTYCTPGGAFLTIQLKDTTPPKDVPDAWYQVRKKVGDIRYTLPAGVLGPFLDDEYGDAASAILAMIPLTRSVFWGPMAIAIMGGLSVATFLTLLNLPALYVLWFRVKRDEPRVAPRAEQATNGVSAYTHGAGLAVHADTASP